MAMELYRNLLPPSQKSAFRIVVGMLSFGLSALWIGLRISDDLLIRPFDWFYAGAFALTGLVHTAEGFGFSTLSLFGKAFIRIDTEQILIKPTWLAKKQQVYWHDIKAMGYTINQYQIQYKDDSMQILKLSKLDYAIKVELKATIEAIAKENNLPLSSPSSEELEKRQK
jgi:hypothetical protein